MNTSSHGKTKHSQQRQTHTHRYTSTPQCSHLVENEIPLKKTGGPAMPLWEVLPTLGNSTHFICLLYGTKCCVWKKKMGFFCKDRKQTHRSNEGPCGWTCSPVDTCHSRRDGSERPEKPVVATSAELACTEKGTLLQRHGDLPQYAHNDCRQVLLTVFNRNKLYLRLVKKVQFSQMN